MSARAGRVQGWVEVGRFVLSDPAGAVPSFLFDHLFTSHGRRQRWWRAAARISPALARRRLAPAGPAAREAGRLLESALAALGEAAGEPGREWIVARPHADDRRGRWTAFLFPPGAALPDRVVKLRRPGAAGDELAGEARALERLKAELPAPLAGTIPAVLRHLPATAAAAEGAGHEALVLSRLPGRSGYVELLGSFAAGSRAREHLRSAGGWLARFHRATVRREVPWPLPPWAELAPEAGAPRPAWHRRLEAALAAAPWPVAAGHGDFWVRNLLVGAGGAEPLPGVVDWEHSRPAAPTFEDLFHFAWTYALAYPWRGRRLEPADAFARGFLRETVLSREIARYLRRYAQETGLDAGVLGELFRVFLLSRTRAGEDTWMSLYRRLEGAERSVFSG